MKYFYLILTLICIAMTVMIIRELMLLPEPNRETVLFYAIIAGMGASSTFVVLMEFIGSLGEKDG